jgi:hypothetical protein
MESVGENAKKNGIDKKQEANEVNSFYPLIMIYPNFCVPIVYMMKSVFRGERSLSVSSQKSLSYY